MRPRYTAAAALSAALLALAVPLQADAAAPQNTLTIDPNGRVTGDGAIILSGTYQCSAASFSGPVLIGSTLTQDGVRQSIGGTTADCDGQTHRWTNVAQAMDSGDEGTFAAGPARVEGTMLQLDSSSGLPLPNVLVTQERAVTLMADAQG
ncbi:hypothetical protein ACZ90_37630 [Streptomyces albus subsp. albus]|nr:hypothetical protein ACZ90_37630 [Streptomyces albus subsp. albus]